MVSRFAFTLIIVLKPFPLIKKIQIKLYWNISTFKLNNLQKCILIWNYLPDFSLLKVSVCFEREKFHALLFLPCFNKPSTPVGYCKSLPHLSFTNFRMYLPHFSLFLYRWEKFHGLLFLTHFNQSSIPEGYWKSFHI